MAMSKKEFIALADEIRTHQNMTYNYRDMTKFTSDQINTLARFCKFQNSNFMRDRWLDYIAGECGPNGGALKKTA